jgi:hypothetical protein
MMLPSFAFRRALPQAETRRWWNGPRASRGLRRARAAQAIGNEEFLVTVIALGSMIASYAGAAGTLMMNAELHPTPVVSVGIRKRLPDLLVRSASTKVTWRSGRVIRNQNEVRMGRPRSRPHARRRSIQ